MSTTIPLGVTIATSDRIYIITPSEMSITTITANISSVGINPTTSSVDMTTTTSNFDIATMISL